jgi:hypothetical protein
MSMHTDGAAASVCVKVCVAALATGDANMWLSGDTCRLMVLLLFPPVPLLQVCVAALCTLQKTLLHAGCIMRAQ